MIYFVQSVDGGPIKIGTTEHLETRLQWLESRYSRPMVLLGRLPGGCHEEQTIHERFSHIRIRNTEQFLPTKELLEFIGKPLFVSANPGAVEAYHCKTSQIRIALDVIELAWKCAPQHGYRGGGAAGDYISDLLRPILLADEASRQGGPGTSPAPKTKPKGGKS